MGKRGKNLTLLDEKSIFIGEDVVLGDGVVIYENNRLEGKTVIGDGCVLLPNNYLKDTVVGANTQVHFSVLEEACVGERVSVGPFARLRPNAVVKDGAKIGNFVEIKNAVIGEGTKVSHLAYVGDADVGKNCNIGCGVIFVNYNGKSKSRSIVGDNAFIGSNANIVAPVNIAKNTYVCAGTTITENVQEDEFVIGRVRQEVKQARAHEYLKEVR